MLGRYFNAFRLASYVLVLFAFGHTTGAVVGTPRFGADSDAVVDLMKSVHVRAQGADCTWYGFYRGFGVFVTVFFVFSVYATWRLGGARDEAERRALLPIGWALFASYLVNLVIAAVYFFPAPIVFSSLVAGLLGYACLRASRVVPAPVPHHGPQAGPVT